MFSSVFHRTKSVHKKVVPVEYPAEPLGQKTSNTHTEIQSSGGKRKEIRREETEISARYSRFEVEGESSINGWNLSSGLSSYTNTCLFIY